MVCIWMRTILLAWNHKISRSAVNRVSSNDIGFQITY
ncbi:Hypothetical protein PAU_00154 [Photorhabdus asymbiotica]|uniref:Uncharacterized protein n=1 Tax=Photorhabdus asymbiotica subsp. asymbiotica (strain ATCC 43949 / 3105-77) TaxID=553480 RepID=C7BGR8_PHOAA|nr:Hypothetical protein PAU_00154 [Photorhabdus asymbiotica]